MMLRYLGLGKRRLGDQPMPAHARLNWEFLAVVRGKLAPFETAAARPKPVASHFWLLPAGVVHGWVGERGKTCEVIVAHFSSVPTPIERLTTKYGLLETHLMPPDLKRLNSAVRVLKAHYWKPTLESEIKAQRVLMELCLLVLRDYKERGYRQTEGGSYSRVIEAEEWLRGHLSECPSIEAAAQHVGVSTSQLYRLFSEIRKETPQEYLNRIKIDHAMELLGHTNSKLDKVASECGFSSASNLCRAFKAAKGRSPTAWRREIYIQYRRPPKNAIDYTQFGRRIRPPL